MSRAARLSRALKLWLAAVGMDGFMIFPWYIKNRALALI
jgi:hypothetical protein